MMRVLAAQIRRECLYVFVCRPFGHEHYVTKIKPKDGWYSAWRENCVNCGLPSEFHKGKVRATPTFRPTIRTYSVYLNPLSYISGRVKRQIWQAVINAVRSFRL